MGGRAGVLDLISRGTGWARQVVGWLEARRRRRRLSRAAQRVGPAPFRRTWAEAEVAARTAVRSCVRIDDFLRARVARYAAALPVPLHELGIAVAVEAGEPVISARATRPSPPPPEGEAIATALELQAARVEVAAAAERATAARSRVDGLARALADELASGSLPAATDRIEASPEQRGRPPVPHPAPQLLLRGASFALLASAAYRMAGPALAVAGLSTDDLADSFARQPLAAAAGILFGTGAGLSVCAFLNVAVERWQDLLSSASPRRRPLVLAAAGTSAALLSAAVAAAAARPGPMAGPLLLVCVSLAAVLLLRQAACLEARHARLAAAALEWDRARVREADERARRVEGVERAEAALAAALREHALLERRLRALERGSAEDARRAELASAESARGIERLAEALAAALELDRYAFVRRTAAQARAGAIRPIRTRPAAVERGVGDQLEAAG